MSAQTTADAGRTGLTNDEMVHLVCTCLMPITIKMGDPITLKVGDGSIREITEDQACILWELLPMIGGLPDADRAALTPAKAASVDTKTVLENGDSR